MLETLRRAAWGLAALLGSSAAWGQAQNLTEVAQQAVLSNPEVLAKWHTFRAAEGERDAAFGGYLPKLDVTAGSGREHRNDPSVQRDYSRHSTALALTQMLYDGFATRNEVKRLDHARRVRLFELQDAAETTALEAARAYLDVLRYRRLVGLAEENFVRHQSVFEQIQVKVQAGVGRKVDLEQAAGRLALAEANLLTESANLHDVSARFQRLAGVIPAKQMAEPPKLDRDLPADANSALTEARRRNPALRAAIENARSADASADARLAAYQPRMDLRLRSERGNNLNGLLGNNENRTAEVVVSWNLFNGLSDAARSRQFAEQLNVAKDQRDKTCRDVRMTLAIAYNDVRKLTEQLVYLDQHQLSTEKARDAYRKQFDIGQRTLLDLLDTENELFEARRAYTNADYNLLTAYVRTHAGTGGLLKSLGLSSHEKDQLPELEQWDAAEDAPEQCPPEAPTGYATDKAALKARALELMRESAPPSPPAANGAAAPRSAPTLVKREQPAAGAETALAAALKAWSVAWSAGDVPGYLSAYAPGFVPADFASREQWAARRKQVIERAKGITLDLADVKLTLQGAERATSAFRQTYRSAGYGDVVRKTLEWERVDGRWLIVRESAVTE